MERVEFEELRSLPDKQIVSDIEFVPSKQAPTTFVFEQVEVSNSLDYELLVYGSYVPDIPSLNSILR